MVLLHRAYYSVSRLYIKTQIGESNTGSTAVFEIAVRHSTAMNTAGTDGAPFMVITHSGAALVFLSPVRIHGDSVRH
jgi:hypothetical protein